MSHVNVITHEKTSKASLPEDRPLHLVGGGHVAGQPTSTDRAPPPVLTPPVEILSRIIELGAEDDRQGFPVLVSHICSRFRDVALSTSTLWSEVNFVGGKTCYPDIEALLDRSRQVPLSIRASQLATTEDADRMLALLLPHVARWKHFHLDVVAEHPLASAEVVMRALDAEAGAPLLESLSILGFTPNGPYNPFSGNTPSLRQLTVRLTHLVWTSPLFSNLESLWFNSQNFSDAALFGTLPHLKSLTIRSEPLAPIAFSFSESHILLPELHTLELNGMTEEDIVRLLSHLEMPVLDRILFTHIKDSQNPVVPNIQDLLTVKTLRLHATEMCQDNLLSVLRKLRNLESISFEDSSPIPTFIAELTPSDNDHESWVIPNVRNFRVVAFEKDNAHRVYDDSDIAAALKVMMHKREHQHLKQMRVRMCVFEGARDEVTRHAAPWDTERAYQSERYITLDA